MRPTKLLIFGSRKVGTPLMLASLSIALDFPVRILVWEGDQGKAWVSYNRPKYLKERQDLPHDLRQTWQPKPQSRATRRSRVLVVCWAIWRSGCSCRGRGRASTSVPMGMVSRRESLKCRPLVSPRLGVFKRGCSAKNGCICESSSDNLQSDRKPVSCKTAGDRCRGLPSEVPRISKRQPVWKRREWAGRASHSFGSAPARGERRYWQSGREQQFKPFKELSCRVPERRPSG